MAGIENDDPRLDVRAAVASLEGGEPVPQGHGDLYSEPAPPEPAQERQRAPAYAEQPAPARTRDAQGRFTAKSDEPTTIAESKVTVDQAAARIEKAIDPTKQDQQPLDINVAPKRWPREARALWDRLPNEVRVPLARQLHADEENLSKAFDIVNGRQQALQTYAQIDQLFAPHRATYARFGFQNDVQALNHLLTLSAALDKNPVQTVAYIAQQYGVVNQLLQMAGQAPQQQYSQQPVDTRALVREEIGLAQAASEIEAFAANPKYPHFHAVKQTMSQLLQSGHARTLEDAYLAAVNANPQLRAEHQRQQAQAEARRQSSSIAAKRRASNAGLSGAPHGAAAPARHSNGRATNAHDDAISDVRAAISQLS